VQPWLAEEGRRAQQLLDAGHKVYRDLIDPEQPLQVAEPRSEYKVTRKRAKPRKTGAKKRG